MSKLKNKLQNMTEGYLAFVKEHPVTMSIVAILIVLAEIIYDKNDMDFIEKTMIFLGALGIQSLYIEETMKKLLSKISALGIAILVASYTTYLSVQSECELIFGCNAEVVLNISERFLCVYGIAAIILTIYHMYKKSGLSFEQYCSSAFCGLVRTSFVFFIVAIGVVLLIVIISLLIFDISDEAIFRIEVILLGGIYGPCVLMALSNAKGSVSKFARGVFYYVLIPLTAAAFLVIYIYIVKIIVALDMPSNEVFSILAWLFALAFPIWTVAIGIKQSDENNNFITKLICYMPYGFIPFIILEIVCISMRISAYGYTHSRYMAVCLIIFQIIYFAVFIVEKILKKPLVHYIMLVVLGMSLCIILIPGINSEDVVIRSQIRVIDSIIDKQTYTDQERATINSAYDEIFYSGYKGQAMLERHYSNEERKLLAESLESTVYDYVFYSGNTSSASVDVAGYDRMWEVSTYCDSDAVGEIVIDGISETVNLTEYVNELISNSDRNNTLNIDGNNRVELDTNRTLVIMGINVTYSVKMDKIDNMGFNGYLLERKEQ